MINRTQLKLDAKAAMRGRRPSVYLVSLAYLIILYILDVLNAAVTLKGTSFAEIAALPPEQAEAALDMMMNSVSVPGVLLGIAIELIVLVLGVGFSIYALAVSRGQEAGFGSLLDGFGIFFKIIWLNIVMGFYVFLWSLLFVIPGIIAAYRYSMALYVLIDNPELGALECLRRSKEMMRGNKFKLFVLELSFIGWILLATIPLVNIYVMPYMETTVCNFYNAVSGKGRGEADYYVYGDV
ncbi:MAG: DUF975 family protein [Oscillospiraceae bacterium]|nr:DUF975 family protein [Oscillospiraceae bacterium]